MTNCIMGEIPEWLLSYLSGKAEIALGAKDCAVAQATLDEVDLAQLCGEYCRWLPLLGEVIDSAKCANDCRGRPDQQLLRGGQT